MMHSFLVLVKTAVFPPRASARCIDAIIPERQGADRLQKFSTTSHRTSLYRQPSTFLTDRRRLHATQHMRPEYDDTAFMRIVTDDAKPLRGAPPGEILRSVWERVTSDFILSWIPADGNSNDEVLMHALDPNFSMFPLGCPRVFAQTAPDPRHFPSDCAANFRKAQPIVQSLTETPKGR
jgi:hypothetical protein